MNKNFIKKHIISTTIFIFLIIYFAIVYTKPDFIFTKQGSIRHFGLGKCNSTILPIWLLVIFMAIMAYLLVFYYGQKKIMKNR